MTENPMNRDEQRAGQRPPRTVRLARWSIRHPWRAIGGWLGLVLAAIVMMALVPTTQIGDDDTRVGQSGEAAAMIDEAGLSDQPVETVLITPERGGQPSFERQAGKAITELQDELAELGEVGSVADPVWSTDGDAALLPIVLARDADQAEDDVPAISEVTERVAKAHPELRIEQSGSTSINTAIWERVGSDLLKAEAISLPITLLIMVFAFGALVAAGVPLLLALTGIAVALGLYAPLSMLVPDAGSVASVVMMIGMAVGVDYCLLYLKRERSERRRGVGTTEAIELAARSAGHAVVLSGLAVMVAMAGLFLSRDMVFAGLAVGAILVVGVAVLGSLTVVPAVLAKLGPRIDKGRVPGLWRLQAKVPNGAISGRLVAPVLRRPVAAALLAGGVLVAISAPALGLKLQSGSLETLPQDVPVVQTAQRVQEIFPSERPTLEVVLSGDPAEVETGLAAVAAAAEGAGVGVPGETRLSDDGRTGSLAIAGPAAEGEQANEDAVTELRDELLPTVLDDQGLGELRWAVGGDVAMSMDYDHNQALTLRLVIVFVLALTMLMIWWYFRSITLALITTALNLLSVGAAFGVMVLVFQYSWADGLLGYTSTGQLINWVPLFCFVVLVGLSMDYHVFVLSRIREHLVDGVGYRDAVRRGITDTASVVTSAAAVMVSVFLAYGFLSMVEMKQMGLSLATAIAIDATVVRLVLLPALMLVFEKRLNRLGGARPVVPERELVNA
ncbi:MMPL family transporter [Nocardioides sp. Bht2]|uniref:MMPL family transporter n=1 Tax=Nocardioides sp. Bht2 TaxID=3392297 RepID=UPI0039B3A465